MNYGIVYNLSFYYNFLVCLWDRQMITFSRKRVYNYKYLSGFVPSVCHTESGGQKSWKNFRCLLISKKAEENRLCFFFEPLNLTSDLHVTIPTSFHQDHKIWAIVLSQVCTSDFTTATQILWQPNPLSNFYVVRGCVFLSQTTLPSPSSSKRLLLIAQQIVVIVSHMRSNKFFLIIRQ